MRPMLFCLLSLLIVSPAFAAEGDVFVAASDMSDSSENVNRADGAWSDLAVGHGRGIMMQWDVRLASEGEYYGKGKFYIHWLMASGESRPCRLRINGEVIREPILGDDTGGFHAPHLRWITTGPYTLEKGENRIGLRSTGFMPHFRGFALSASAIAPEADPFEAMARELRAKHAEAFRKKNRRVSKAAREKLTELLPDLEQILFVRRYTLQSSHYYTDFIDGCRFFGGGIVLLSLKDGSVTPVVPGPVSGEDLAGGIFGRIDLSLDGKKVAFGYKRRIGEGFRIWEVNLDGTGLRQLTFPPEDETERIKKYRLEWHNAYYHHTDDMHPCYLPDGGIAFASTRVEHGILCDGRDILTSSVIYRMDGDGKNIEKMSENSVSETSPALMNDGRILYTRWEYVDNGSVSNKGLWAMHPDGSGTVEIGGMSIAFPSVFNVGRAIPGHNNMFICIGAPHMPLGVGTVMKVDTRHNARTGAAVSYVTGKVDVRHQWGWDSVPEGATRPIPPDMQSGRDGRGNTDKGPLYMDPYPLSEDHTLVSHNPDRPWNDKSAYGLYLMGTRGQTQLLYQDPEFSSWNPIPVRLRPHIPVIPPYAKDEALAQQNLARVVVMDVYRGMDGVDRGAVKYLRINEHVSRHWAARRFWIKEGTPADCYDQQHSVITKDTHLGLKMQHGIVPVEEDGSAHFLVPADRNIFLQALDENYMEVQRERTFVNYRPGEVRSCAGCHERQSELTTPDRLPLAMQRAADSPGPQPGEVSGARPLHYPDDVQPILDKHCVTCHGTKRPEANLNLTGRMTSHFSRSYEELLARDQTKAIGENHPKAGNNHYVPPYSLGAHVSTILPYFTQEHEDVQLSQDEMIRITTWIDSNYQFYGGYIGRKHIKHKGHPDFRITPLSKRKVPSSPPPRERNNAGSRSAGTKGREIGDDGGAGHVFPIVEDSPLSGRHGALGFLEGNRGATVMGTYGAGGGGVLGTDLNPAAESIAARRRRTPRNRSGGEVPAIRAFLIRHDQGVPCHIKPHHVERPRRGNTQPPALSHRVVRQAAVFTEHLSTGR